MTNSEKAIHIFTSGFNCAQSVIAVFCEKYGVDKEVAFKLTSGLGGGYRSGEVCGVISGAVLVIGLKYGQSVADDTTSKRICYEKTEEFINQFRNKCGAIRCYDILGYDIASETDREEIKKKDLFKVICEKQVENAVVLLEELGY